MRNQLDNLEEAGMSFDEVVETNVYLDDLSDLAAFDAVYVKYFGPILAGAHHRAATSPHGAQSR